MIGAAALALLAGCGNNNEESIVDEAGEVVDEAVKSAERAAEDAVEAVVKLRKGDPSEAEAALAAMSLAASGDGRVTFDGRDIDGAGAEFSAISIAIPGEDEDDGASITAASLTFEGLDMTEAGATFSEMVLSDIALIPNDPEDAEEGSLNVGTVRLVNPTPELAAWVASLMGEGEPAEFPEASMVGFDLAAIKDLNFQFDDGDSNASFGLADFTVSGVDEEKMASAVMSGLTFAGTDPTEDMDFTMSLGKFAIQGAKLSLLSVIQENIDNEDEMAAAILETVYANPVEPGYDGVEMTDLSFSGGGIDFAMPSYDVEIERNREGLPVEFTTKPFTMTLSADPAKGEPGAQLGAALGMVGYETVEVSGEGFGKYDPENDIISYDTGRNYLKLKDGFTFSFGGKLEGYSAYAGAFAQMDFEEMIEGGEPDPMLMQEALGKLVLHDMELKFADDSFVDRMFNVAAAQSGEDPAALRQQAVAMVGMGPMMAASSGADMELINEAAQAISSFLQDPKTLTLSLKPQEPLSMATLSAIEDPSQITKAYLGFSASNE